MTKRLRKIILRWRAVRAMLMYGVLSKNESEKLWGEIVKKHMRRGECAQIKSLT